MFKWFFKASLQMSVIYFFLLIFSMIISGFVGTILGKKILVKYGSKYFKIILNATLTIIAIYLLWNAITISKILNDLNLFA